MPSTDCLGNRLETIPLQQGSQSLFDPAHQTGTGKNEGGIELHQRGARSYFCIGVLGAADPANPDQRQLPSGHTVHVCEERGRWTEQRAPAEATTLMRVAAEQTRGTPDCRVRDDQPVDSGIEHDPGNVLPLFNGKIRRDLHQ